MRQAVCVFFPPQKIVACRPSQPVKKKPTHAGRGRNWVFHSLVTLTFSAPLLPASIFSFFCKSHVPRITFLFLPGLPVPKTQLVSLFMTSFLHVAPLSLARTPVPRFVAPSLILSPAPLPCPNPSYPCVPFNFSLPIAGPHPLVFPCAFF